MKGNRLCEDCGHHVVHAGVHMCVGTPLPDRACFMNNVWVRIPDGRCRYFCEIWTFSRLFTRLFSRVLSLVFGS